MVQDSRIPIPDGDDEIERLLRQLAGNTGDRTQPSKLSAYKFLAGAQWDTIKTKFKDGELDEALVTWTMFLLSIGEIYTARKIVRKTFSIFGRELTRKESITIVAFLGLLSRIRNERSSTILLEDNPIAQQRKRYAADFVKKLHERS